MPLSSATVSLAHLADWLSPITQRAGDRRTATLLLGTVAGILGSGSLVCRQIAAFSPLLATGRYADCRIRRMLAGDTTRRSDLEPEAIFAALRKSGWPGSRPPTTFG